MTTPKRIHSNHMIRRCYSLVSHNEINTAATVGNNNQQPDPRFLQFVMALEKDNFNLVKTVLNDGLSVNYKEPSLVNRSPIHYATKHNRIKVIEELIRRDVDAIAADVSGITALHIAASNGQIDILRLIIPIVPNIDPLDKNGRSPLHFASRLSTSEDNKTNNSIIEVCAALLSAGASCGLKDIDGRMPIHMAAASGNSKVVRLLSLGRGMSYLSSGDNDGLTPLHYAVQKARSLDTVTVLLECGAKIDAVDKNGTTALHIVSARSINYIDEEFDGSCLEILLHSGASVTARDDSGDNALTLALKRTMWWNRRSPRNNVLQAVKMLIAKGSPITDTFTMWRMMETFPSLVAVALNQSFRVNTSACDSALLRLDFDIRPLIENSRLMEVQEKLKLQQRNANGPINANVIPEYLSEDSEISIVRYILWVGHKATLKHPLIKAFLHLKWLEIRSLFVLNFIFFILFVASLTVYLISIKDKTYPRSDQNNSSTAYYLPDDKSCSTCPFTWHVLVWLYFLHVIREIIQFFDHPIIYIRHFENLLDIFLIIFIPLIITGDCRCLYPWQIACGAVTIVMAWLRLMYLLGQFPICGVYIVMFSKVAKNVLTFLGLYLFLLVGFAFGFHILMNTTDSFKSPITSLMSILVMMTGEIEYSDQFLGLTNTQQMIPCFVILILFILLIYIILTNLLVALAVNDLADIQQRSELLRLTRQVELLMTVESLIRGRLVPERIRNFLLKCFSITKGQTDVVLSVFPNIQRNRKEQLYLFLTHIFGMEQFFIRVFELFSNSFVPPEQGISIPIEVVNEAKTIALNEKEIEIRDQFYTMKDQLLSKTNRHILPMQSLPTSPSTNTISNSISSSQDSQESQWPLIVNELENEADDMFISPHCSTWQHSTPSLRRVLWKEKYNKQIRSRQNVLQPNSSEEIEDLRHMVEKLQSSVDILISQFSNKTNLPQETPENVCESKPMIELFDSQLDALENNCISEV